MCFLKSLVISTSDTPIESFGKGFLYDIKPYKIKVKDK